MWRDGSKDSGFVHVFDSARLLVGGCVTVVTVIYGIDWNCGRWNRELLFGPNVFVPIIRRCVNQSLWYCWHGSIEPSLMPRVEI